jgi:cytochrome c5
VSGVKPAVRATTAAWLAVALGCASAPRSAPAAATAPAAPAPTVSVTPASELPDGRGKQILMASCTSCHDLREVTKFRGYYDRAQWRDIVVTMVEYGANVEKQEVEVLSDYLVQHLGRR